MSPTGTWPLAIGCCLGGAQRIRIRAKILVESSGEDFEVPLPTDIENLEKWGQTVCELPKVKSAGYNYTELITAETTYAKWVQDNACRLKGNPLVQDMAAFLKRAGLKLVTKTKETETVMHRKTKP